MKRRHIFLEAVIFFYSWNTQVELCHFLHQDITMLSCSYWCTFHWPFLSPASGEKMLLGVNIYGFRMWLFFSFGCFSWNIFEMAAPKLTDTAHQQTLTDKTVTFMSDEGFDNLYVQQVLVTSSQIRVQTVGFQQISDHHCQLTWFISIIEIDAGL